MEHTENGGHRHRTNGCALARRKISEKIRGKYKELQPEKYQDTR